MVTSHRLTEVTDRLEAGVDRRQDLGHGAGLLGDDRDAADDRIERPAYGDEVSDHSGQAEGGGGDDERRDDQGHPGNGGHGILPSRSAEQFRDGAGVADRTG